MLPRLPRLSKVPLVCCLFLSCLDSSAKAQQLEQLGKTPRASKDRRAMVAAQDTLATMGIQAIPNYRDSEATGTLVFYNDGKSFEYPIVLKSRGTQDSSVEVQMSKGRSVRLLNHGRGVIRRPDGFVRALSTSNTYTERISHIPVLSILSEYKSPSLSILYQGTNNIGQQSEDVVAVRLEQNTGLVGPRNLVPTILFFVNQATRLIDKTQYSNYAENDSADTETVEVYFSDYRQVDGISVPFRQRIYIDKVLDSVISLTTVAFNVGLPDSEFTLPEMTHAK